MKKALIRPLTKVSILLTVFLWASSCEKDFDIKEEGFYSYDFESDYTNLDSVFVSEFNGTRVLGPFNNSGFSARWDNLPEHHYIRLTFDLYIHDSWEGNSNDSGNGRLDHDAWMIEFDPHLKVKPHEKVYFETTFSNSLCIPGWCFTQSYPGEFPSNNRARTEANPSYLFGRCLYADAPNGTSVYRMNKVFPHDESSVVIAFYDRLKQDGPFPALCEESWSLDNLSISLIRR